jgi:hypothetical protein
MSRPSYPSWFNHPNNIRWRIQAVKFIRKWNSGKSYRAFKYSPVKIAAPPPLYIVAMTWKRIGDMEVSSTHSRPRH